MAVMQQLLPPVSTWIRNLKEMKRGGTPIVGYIPNGYMPEELVHACGAIPVALVRGGDSAPVAASASCLARFLDPFCRAQIGYRILKEDPLYQMIDLLIVPVTDNHIRAIADSWDLYTDVEVFRLGVPHVKAEHGFQYYLESINQVKAHLEKVTGTVITPSTLREKIERENKIRSLFRKISLMRRSEQPPITGKEFIEICHHSFHADRQTLLEFLESLCESLKAKEPLNSRGPRLLLTGSTLASGDYTVVDLLEEAGASIVIEDFSEGLREYWEVVEIEDDLMQSLAKRYFSRRIPGAFFRGATKERFGFFLKLVADFNVDGVIWYSLMYRDSYDVEGYLFHKALRENDIPMLRLQSDYDATETGSFRIRIETFVDAIQKA